MGVRPERGGRLAAMTRRFIAAAVSALVLTLVYMYSGERTPPPLPPELADEPDTYMEGAAITKFGADGGVRYRLRAERIRQFEGRGVTYFENPTMRLHQKSGPPWLLSASRGELRQPSTTDGARDEVLRLSDNVELTRQYDDGQRFALTTTELNVYPARQYAQTDQAVMIETSGSKTTAAGFEADMERGWVKLLSGPAQRVHGVVEPGRRNRIL